jgi:3-methylfumaryl-CoA hydratase
MTEPLDIAHLRSWIGREEEASEVVTPELVQKFRATLDLPGGKPAPGEPAPPLIHLCLAQPAVPQSGLGPDGHPARGGFLPPVPLPRRMWAGGEFAFRQDIRVGDVVRRVSRIAEVVLKEGRTGPLCFVTVRHRVEAADAIALEERQDIVYRAADTVGAVKPMVPAEAGSQQREVDPSPVLLFRYSALTFNGHRIHYDRRYATEVEGYPGLVVHGPLQATWLLNFAASIRGTPPSRFSFRGLSTLFDDDAVRLHAREDGDRLKLWTARDGGPVAMSAEAAWS